LLLALNRYDDADEVYTALIAKNPESKAYYDGLEKAKQITTDESRLALYDVLSAQYPKAFYPKRQSLFASTGIYPFLDAELRRC
jgi:hypothetical protein